MACARTGSTASSDSRAPLGLPGRLTMRLPPRTPTTPRLRLASGVFVAAGGAHRLGDSRHVVLDDGLGRLRRHVARRQAGATGGHDQRVARRAVDQRRFDRGLVVGHDQALDAEAEGAEPIGHELARRVGALAGRALVTGRDDEGGQRRPSRMAPAVPRSRPRLAPGHDSAGRPIAGAGLASARRRPARPDRPAAPSRRTCRRSSRSGGPSGSQRPFRRP